MTDYVRPNPDALLAAIQSDAAKAGRGRLKVFVGMCPGVGKTYAMLEAARRERQAGRDVVIGYVETHGRAETDALARDLPQIPRRQITYRGVRLTELDLDAVLARRPSLVLVDELAHSNAPESRHPKRWQEVQELLDAGLDVFTTVNVQHLESRAETVRQITGAEIRETVPDSVLDQAVLELVDLPPAELLQRLHEGKVYLPDRAAAAARNFFREANLTALRELALRLVADHVGGEAREWRRTQGGTGAWKTAHCLVVAVGPSPASASLIRWTRRMADGLQCRWLAVHVENSRPLSEAAQAQLARNLATARELGAEVLATSDEDLVKGLLRVAREQNATQVVVGKPGGAGPLARWRGSRLLRRLTRESGDIDLHVVRAEKQGSGIGRPASSAMSPASLNQYLLSFGAVAMTGLVNLLLQRLAGPRVPGLVFLLAVVLLALFVGRGPVLMAGALSALGWNFLFLPPRFTFAIWRAEDVLLLGTYFVVAVVLGQLVARIRAQGEAGRRREARATALYELLRDLADAGSPDELVWHLIAQVTRVFGAPAAVCLPSGGRFIAHPDSTLTVSDKELGVARWALDHRQAAGRFTDTLPGAAALHLPLATESRTFGVLSVGLPGKHLALAQRELLETFAVQAALVLERIELRAAAAQASLVAESERLGRALLNSISHELRTPLAASTSAVSALAEAETPELRGALLAELQEAGARLNRVVGNLLDVARLEAGNVRPRPDWHDLGDLVQGAVRDLQRELAAHSVAVELPAEATLARVDFSLLQHALANLVLNAAAHTPPGTPITVRAEAQPDAVVLSVADRGPGIPAEVLPRIFDKFFRGPGTAAGGSGLGLTIARGFVEALGGRITAANREGGGAVFSIWLPQAQPPPSSEPVA